VQVDARLLGVVAVLLAAEAGDGDQEGPLRAGLFLDFVASRRMLRWEAHQASLERVPCPGWSGRLEMFPGPWEFPGASLEVVVRDWSGHRRLCCSLTVEGGPLELFISVRGDAEATGQTSHYDVGQTFGPGEHQAELDLAVAAARARPGHLNLKDVRQVVVFVVRPSRRRAVCLRRVWLE
jgi:hypothetical protein